MLITPKTGSIPIQTIISAAVNKPKKKKKIKKKKISRDAKLGLCKYIIKCVFIVINNWHFYKETRHNILYENQC